MIRLATPVVAAVLPWLDARPRTIYRAGKRKTRRWERRVSRYCYRSYGFKYAAWLLLMAPEGDELLLLLWTAKTFCSCSSFFLLFSSIPNLTEAFAFSHRFLSLVHLSRPGFGGEPPAAMAVPPHKNIIKSITYS